MKLKDICSLEESYDKPGQHIKKQRHYFAYKGPYNQRYGFSSSHVWMWELDHKESWAPKNWCFGTVVLEKTLESPLDCKEIWLVNLKGNRSWIFTGRTDTETPILWPPDVKSWLIGKDSDAGKDWRQEKGTTKDEMVVWHNRLNGHEFEQTLGVGDGQGSLVCCSPWGWKESDTTEQLNWTELDCKEIKPVNPKGNQPEYSLEGLMLKDWSSNTLATWWEELTHWKRLWCWKRLRAEQEGDDRGWDGWMASLTQWTWIWANFREIVKDIEAWHAAIHKVAKSQPTANSNVSDLS